MSEEADYLVESLKMMMLCNMNRYIIRGQTLSYEALYTRLEEKGTYRFLWYNLHLNQPFGPPDVAYYSPAFAESVKAQTWPSNKVTWEPLPW